MSTNKKRPSSAKKAPVKPAKYAMSDSAKSVLEANLRILFGTEKQETIAIELGVARQTVSGYIPDQNREEPVQAHLPSLPVLYAIAEKYNVSMDWLCGRAGSVKSLAPDIQTVNRITGLSEEAIRNLVKTKEPPPQIDVNTGITLSPDPKRSPVLAVLRSQSAYADVRDNYGMEAYFRALDDVLASKHLRSFIASLDDYFYTVDGDKNLGVVLDHLADIKTELNEKYGLLEEAGYHYKEMTSRHFSKMYKELSSLLNTGVKTKQDIAGYAIFLNKMDSYLQQTYTADEISTMKEKADFSRLKELKPDYGKLAKNEVKFRNKARTKGRGSSKTVLEPERNINSEADKES